MNDESLKALIERLASECDAYIDLVAFRKDLMTQKTYSTKRDHHLSEIGDTIALLIESRLKALKSGGASEDLKELQAEYQALTGPLLDFIDSRIRKMGKTS